MRAFRIAVCALIVSSALQACGGGGGGSPVPPPGGGNGGAGLPATITAAPGAVDGADNQFSPADGDSSSGGNGQTVDGIPCLSSLDESHYHVHVFLGFVMNGSEQALPDGTGMNNPGADVNGFVATASCFYYIHTHDASGIIHVEDPSTASPTTALHTLGQYVDIWGHSFGSVQVYTSGSYYQGQGDQTVSNSTYSLYAGDPRSIPLYSHEVIWIEEGPMYLPASALPAIHFTY